MGVKLRASREDVLTLKSLIKKRASVVRLPHTELINVYLDHVNLARETRYEDFTLSKKEFILVAEAINSKIGKTKEISIKRICVTKLIQDHEEMMQMVERSFGKWHKIK